MARTFEIHLVKVEETQASASVSGEIGNWYGSDQIAGRIRTLHQSTIFSGNRLYRLSDLTGRPAVRGDDELIAVCRRARDGAYEVMSYVNRSNGTQFTRPYWTAILYGWVLFLVSLISILLIVGLVLAPFLLYQAIKMTFVTYPQIRAANAELAALAAVRDPAALSRRIEEFNAATVVTPTVVPPTRAGRLFQIDLPDRPSS